MAAQHFFVFGRHLGSRVIDSYRRVPGLEVKYQPSYALYCHACGDIWGRIIHQGAQITQIRCTLCSKHGDGRLSPLHNWPDDPCNFDPSWPKAAITHEFFVELTHYERKHKP